MLQNNPILKAKIDQLWNKFWAGGIANPLTAIEQITYLLFMKRLDDLDLKQQADAEFTGDKFTSRFAGTWVPPEHRNRPKKDQKPFEVKKETLRWSKFTRMTADEMVPHVQNKVFPFLKDINGRESSFTDHMKNAVFIISKPSLLVEAVKTIDEIFKEIEKDSQEKGQAFQDIQGDVYEYLLSEIAQAGKNGQFRTPRHIIKLMAELVQPQLGHRIADPACGTAGIIVPQGVLFGSAGAFVEARKILVDRCDLKAVVTIPSGVFKPYAGVSTAILVFTKVYDKEDKVTEPGTEHVWFYDMDSDGYSLDDKRNKLDGYGDLQDIFAKFKKRHEKKDTDRTRKWFVVPRQEIVDEKYDLSLSRYKEEVFEEIEYEKPGVILRKLLESEVGKGFDEDALGEIQGGIVKELLELKRMVG